MRNCEHMFEIACEQQWGNRNENESGNENFWRVINMQSDD